MEKIKQVWQVIEHYNKLEKWISDLDKALEVLEDEGMDGTQLFNQLCQQRIEFLADKADFEKLYVTFQ